MKGGIVLGLWSVCDVYAVPDFHLGRSVAIDYYLAVEISMRVCRTRFDQRLVEAFARMCARWIDLVGDRDFKLVRLFL